MSAENSTVGSVASTATNDSNPNSSPPPEPEIVPNESPSKPGIVTPPPIVYDSGPCSTCNLPLQTATEIISYIGMVFAVVLIVVGASVFAVEPTLVDQSLIIRDPTAKAKDTESLTNALEYGSVVNLCRGFYDLILYPMLWMGAIFRNRRLCIVWLIAKLVLFCILLMGIGFVLLLFGHAYISMCPLILLIPEFYFLWVVLCFSEELKVIGDQPGIEMGGGPEGNTADMNNAGIHGSGTGTPAGDELVNRGHGDDDFPKASIVSVGASKRQSMNSVGGWGTILAKGNRKGDRTKK